MKYLDEYRDADLVHKGLEEIRRTVTHPWSLMEICGGQTHSIMRHGLDQLLPEGIEVIEQSVGRAIGNWILQVRCQCGRRWFESTPVEATHCPRCGMYVYIDVQPGPGPQAP